MKVVYVSKVIESEIPDRSIFLAGPSPRGDMQYNWRPEALDVLSDLGFNGSVFIPLRSDWLWLGDWEAQVDWELYHLNLATVIVFWVPRDLKTLPGFTTNVEYGMFVKSGKIVLGYPEGAPKLGYLNYLAKLNSVPVSHSLRQTLLNAVKITD